MNYYPFDVASIIFALGQVAVFGAVVVFLVFGIRLIMAATRALNAVTTERTLRIERLRTQRDDGDLPL